MVGLFYHCRVYFLQFILLGASELGIELHCRVLLRIVYGNTYARVSSLQLPCTFPTIHFIGRVTINNRVTLLSFLPAARKENNVLNQR